MKKEWLKGYIVTKQPINANVQLLHLHSERPLGGKIHSRIAVGV